ncbi:MAG: methyltransferase domain-containing protein [Actinobacteria bacterium]|nr:methyltransferase domain-containing protein [Actinomycetota bacterium]
MEAAKRRELVRRGYDAISRLYRDDEGRSLTEIPPDWIAYHEAWVGELTRLLPAGSRVLDLGCGCGVPATRLLASAGFDTVGLDFSHVQIERARGLVPEAAFIEADMVTWDAEPGSFDAVASFYALIHVPLEDQRALFPRVRRWLRDGGLLIAIVGHERWTGVEEYYGAPMFWDHADTPTYQEWLGAAGFDVLSTRFVPEGESGHTLVLAEARPYEMAGL